MGFEFEESWDIWVVVDSVGSGSFVKFFVDGEILVSILSYEGIEVLFVWVVRSMV